MPAINGFTKAVAYECRPPGITCNANCQPLVGDESNTRQLGSLCRAGALSKSIRVRRDICGGPRWPACRCVGRRSDQSGRLGGTGGDYDDSARANPG